jgi:hypothetical protein
MDDQSKVNEFDEKPEQDLHQDEKGATTLEWTLLLGAIAIPSYYIIDLCLQSLAGHYRMVTLINSLPFP